MPLTRIEFDVSTWPSASIAELMALAKRLDAASRGPRSSLPCSEASHRRVEGGWTVVALGELLSRLKVSNGVVQAEAIRVALDNGGQVDRAEVYTIGGYGPDRSLKGFTRPINRIVEQMKTDGLLPADAVPPFKPDYDEDIASYQRAPSFVVAKELLELWNGE